MKGLLIAYSFSPLKTVGALRPTYWAEEISSMSNYQLDVLTNTDGEEDSRYRRIVIPNDAKSTLSLLIKDEGLTWRKSILKRAKELNLEEYSFVIFTGGPFFHFSLGKYFKKKGLKIIYDFRDPFSYNPRHNERGFKKWIKTTFENKFLKSADLVITVNDACHNYIGPGLSLKRAIIPNGYDERMIPEISGQPSTDMFYGGKFYWEPPLFFDVLKDRDLSMNHAGMIPSFHHTYMDEGRYNHLGLVDQRELYNSLNEAEIGVVFTMDVPFESTTKIYDYLALGKKILIITRGEPHVGVLKRELSDYPMYKWVNYNRDDIEKAIIELKEMEQVTVDASIFARKSGLQKLINEIDQLFN